MLASNPPLGLTPPSFNYRVAEYRFEGKRFREVFEYRWVDPTFALEERLNKKDERIRELQDELSRLAAKVLGPEFKNDRFDDGMGGW